jgi:hypothetical protein
MFKAAGVVSDEELMTGYRRFLNDAEQQEMLVCVDEELKQQGDRRAPRPW